MSDPTYLAQLQRAQACLRSGDWREAERLGRLLLEHNTRDVRVLDLLAHAAAARGDFLEAVRRLQNCVALEPRVLEHHLNLGGMLTRCGQFQRAVARLEKARALAPNDLRVLAGLADAYHKSGSREQMLKIVQPLMQAGADDANIALLYARAELDAGRPKSAIAALSRHIDSPSFPPASFFLLGRAYERLGEIDKAFDAYRQGNQRQPGSFNLQAFVNRLVNIMTTFRRDKLARLPRPSIALSVTPLIIAGRPRSGTTLIEKILDAHPAVTGIGENKVLYGVAMDMQAMTGSNVGYPLCVPQLAQAHIDTCAKRYFDHAAAVAPGAAYIADKTLANIELLGLIQALMPNARVIVCLRDPLDTCFSCYAEDLRTHGYASDLRLLGITQRWYERIMDHWRQELDLPMLDVRYEQLIADQEGQTRRLIEFCGLPWDDRCLRHHDAAKSDKPRDTASGPTLSFSQVQQPIYATAVGRAAKFSKHLDPLHEGLAEGDRLLAQFGLA